jgi:DNA-binding response OmpR family regulator
MRVLIVEDDAEAAGYLAKGLRESGHTVDVAATGKDGLLMAAAEDYDVLVVDRMLPGNLDGVSLVRHLRATGSHVPVLFLSALGDVDDRVEGLRAGGDDYLVKPFAFSELTARLRALARRGDAGGAVLRVGDLTLDAAAHRAWRAGVELELTAREFSLLRYFMHHPGEVLSAEVLLEHVWDANADPFTSSPRTILSRLRRKLGDPSPIVTIPSAGYRLEER